MTKQHQTRLDIIPEDIGELQKNQTTTMAKIAQYKRKLMDLSHRTLQVLIKQEIQRKSGYAIQADEEQLRVQLDTIQGELNAPTQFKGPSPSAGDLRCRDQEGRRGSEEAVPGPSVFPSGASERRGILWRWRGPSGLRWVWRNGRGLP